MNAREWIASGLLEAYVLGEGSVEERALVERMAATEPEIRAELEAIETALEAHAMATAVEPPPAVKAAVLQAVQGNGKGKVLPIAAGQAGPASRNWLAAAALVALLASGAGNFLLFSRLGEVNERLAILENERAVLAQQMQVQQTALEQGRQQLAVVFDPAKHMVPLAGQVLDPGAAARVYMDPSSSEIYLDVLSLPAAPAGKQYQLWAQVDGKMVDAGMLDLGAAGDSLQRMKTIANATAFGVTLEPEGGSMEPTLSALYLFGPVG
jgi:anti-sigma-K factor RskA